MGATQFYERKEVKDLLAYLKLTVNPADDVAFRRVVNVPARGIGDTSVDLVLESARGRGEPLLAASRRLVADGALPARSHKALGEFVALVDGLAARAAAEPAALVIEAVLEVTGYAAYLERSFPGESFDRMENVRALVSAAVEYEKDVDEPTLPGFLDRSALTSDADEVGARPGVTLMTVHNAKGLEFPVIFLAGLRRTSSRTPARGPTPTTWRRSAGSATSRSRARRSGCGCRARCRGCSRASPSPTARRDSWTRYPRHFWPRRAEPAASSTARPTTDTSAPGAGRAARPPPGRPRARRRRRRPVLRPTCPRPPTGTRSA